MPTLEDARQALQKHWGYANFRKSQATIIEYLLEGEDVLGVLATGYGKSACFQVPAVILEGTAIVVSPLIALMKDQCDDANKRGIRASFVNSHVDEEEQDDRLAALADGDYDLFYIAPERIRSRRFLDALRSTDVCLLVVDEAHCASRWGHDFRPAYRRIVEITKLLERRPNGRPPILAVTATATYDIEDDIADAIGMSADAARIVGDPIRPNLSYEVLRGYNPWRDLEDCIDWMDSHSGRHVLYSGTRKGAEKVAEIVRDRLNIPASSARVGVYHAGMTKPEREMVQNAFKAGSTPIIVATCAFGMGIDVPNIRSVVHFGIPGSLEDYCQESGRAGRDGDPSRNILIADSYGVDLRQRFLDMSNPPWEFYPIVWGWLHEELTSEEESLTLSAKAMFEAICAMRGGARVGTHELTDSAIGGVLSTMEAYGLLTRRYCPPTGTGLECNVAAVKSFGLEGLNPKHAALITAVRQMVEAESLVGDKYVMVMVDRAELANKVGSNELALKRLLKSVGTKHDLWSVQRQFTGKTTQFRPGMMHQDLDDVLERDRIDAKREREQTRLNHMIEYSEMTGPADARKDKIREYFAKALA